MRPELGWTESYEDTSCNQRHHFQTPRRHDSIQGASIFNQARREYVENESTILVPTLLAFNDKEEY